MRRMRRARRMRRKRRTVARVDRGPPTHCRCTTGDVRGSEVSPYPLPQVSLSGVRSEIAWSSRRFSCSRSSSAAPISLKATLLFCACDSNRLADRNPPACFDRPAARTQQDLDLTQPPDDVVGQRFVTGIRCPAMIETVIVQGPLRTRATPSPTQCIILIRGNRSICHLSLRYIATAVSSAKSSSGTVAGAASE